MFLSVSKDIQKQLLTWFKKHKRDLPWRKTKDPYKIWISEVMLQQTTSKAVIPYYENFLKKFPNLSSLANANKKSIYSLWAGLGYYKRADNLIKAAKELNKIKKWPKNYKELLKLPGFGPYTSRAVSSLAFEKPVGVLDGNVIRFLTRFYALPLAYWKMTDRHKLQSLSDLWVQKQKSSQINQALMEIGSVICRSKNPLCLLCPVMKNCKSHQKGLQYHFPVRKKVKLLEYWHWQPKRIQKLSRWAFVKNTYLPFLKGRFIFPGEAQRLRVKAKKYDFIHSIMHYQIYVTIQNKKTIHNSDFKWFTPSQIKKINPSSLIKKVLEF